VPLELAAFAQALGEHGVLGVTVGLQAVRVDVLEELGTHLEEPGDILTEALFVQFWYGVLANFIRQPTAGAR
jgi:hypothetical protein